MKIIQFDKEILFDLQRNLFVRATDLEYISYPIFISLGGSEIINEDFKDNVNQDVIYISKRDFVELFQTNKLTIDFTTILLY